jgi:phosphoglycolate phosphatase-like HAD superfamily hydrolase
MHRRLVLFDIDGTLISDGGAARQAYGTALAKVYGYRGDLGRYDFSGRTDPQITHMVLGDAGYPAADIDSRLELLWGNYLAALEQNLEARGSRALPGIPELVAALADRGDIMLGLLTGNIEPGARLKLGPPALNDYFPFGAFGSDSARREELPPIAVERASRYDGHRFEGRNVVIIGDSIYDVRCGVPHDATTIAIASGKTSAATLLAEEPHHFFDSAAELDEILTAIVG